jgi:hypothetical protein
LTLGQSIGRLLKDKNIAPHGLRRAFGEKITLYTAVMLRLGGSVKHDTKSWKFS